MVCACPLTHLKLVGAARLRSWYAAIWSHSALFTPIHPLSSHAPRCFVRLSITYLESVVMVIGVVGSVCWMAAITATISPI